MTTRIRAGIIAPGLWSGGAEQWMYSLFRHCDPARVEWLGAAVLYEQHAGGPMRDVIARHVPVGAGPEAVDALYAHADIVLIWGIASADQRIPPPPRSCRVVLVSHGMGHWTARVFDRPEQADALVGVSPASISPMPPEVRDRTRIILNCYEPQRVIPTGQREQLRASWGVRPGEKVVGYLGRISPEKNPEALILMAAACPDVRGVFVGGGSTDHLRQCAKVLGVADRIVFHGLVAMPGDVLAAFDWLLLPSHEEACSITLLEAWAAGTPAIATPVGVVTEHPELVRMVATSPSGPQLATALARDLINPAGVQARIEQAREVALATYSPSRFGGEWTDFFVDLAGTQAERPPLGNVFAALSSVKSDMMARAAACPNRSRRNWHAICRAGVGGIAPHHVVTAEDCCGCLERGGLPR
ncbi:MAG: glycosyltransferase family 4 protein [Isosphaeraceae bacterium]|nr:glycosyltransferase family 4 protein [Isosphaeraceae bacterium]